MLVIVGGHSRNIGKTSVVEGVIRALPEAGWAAVKITQYGHDACAADGNNCECAAGLGAGPAQSDEAAHLDSSLAAPGSVVPESAKDHLFALTEEHEPGTSDSGRYLGAGARRAFWLRTAAGELGHAIPALRTIVEDNKNVILESNSAMQFFTPDLYIVVLDPAIADMKESTRRYFDRANAFVVIDRPQTPLPWPGVPQRWFTGKPRFLASPPAYVDAEMSAWLRVRIGNCTEQTIVPTGRD